MFILLRSFTFQLVFYITIIITCLLLIFSLPLTNFKQRHVFVSYYIFGLLFLLKYICKISHKVHGLENLKKSPTIFVANHQAVWEVLFLITLINPTIPIVKKELLLIPFFGWGLSLLRPITINRSKKVVSLKKIIKIGKERITQKFSILIFPEGTRLRPDVKEIKIKRSGLQLACQTNTTITPIYHNSGNYWKNKSFIKKPGQIEVFIGKQIKSNNVNDLKKDLEKWMKQKIDGLNV